MKFCFAASKYEGLLEVSGGKCTKCPWKIRQSRGLLRVRIGDALRDKLGDSPYAMAGRVQGDMICSMSEFLPTLQLQWYATLSFALQMDRLPGCTPSAAIATLGNLLPS